MFLLVCLLMMGPCCVNYWEVLVGRHLGEYTLSNLTSIGDTLLSWSVEIHYRTTGFDDEVLLIMRFF